MVAQGVDGGSPVMKPTAEPSKEVFNDAELALRVQGGKGVG